MKVIEGTNVDLISPFPVAHVARVYDWMHCYKNITINDSMPQEEDEYLEVLRNLFPQTLSFGVIDKHNVVGYSHQAPLVGMIAFEQSSPYNAYAHVASNRKAWKHRLLDEAGEMAIAEAFSTLPILRISGFALEENRPIRFMVQRLGFHREGIFEDWVTQGGIPKTMFHFGLTRRAWEERKLSKEAPIDPVEPQE